MRNSLTLCPYLLEPIVNFSTKDVSDEHIIPYALGGSNKLILSAEKIANSKFGETVDSDLIHDQQLRFIAATQNVNSRSGSITVTLPAIVLDTGDEMTVEFNKNGIGARKIKYSHRRDALTNQLSEICGFDDQFEANLSKLKNANKKWVGYNHQRIDNPLIKVEIGSDPFKVSKGLAKIAYLMNCRTFGDEFVLSTFGDAYRKATQAKSWDEFDNCGLHLLWASEFALIFLPKIESHQHLLAVFCANGLTFTTVMLFGGVVTFTFAFASSSMKFNNFCGHIILNDCKQRTCSEHNLQDIVSLNEMVERIIEYNQRQQTQEL